MDEWKRSGHIPAFGNWDLANELPITRYFECATTTQPRLARYTSSSAQTRHHNKPRPLRNHNKQKQEARCRHGNKGKLYDVREQPRKAIRISKQLQKDDTVPRTPKPVDEDLYKIPPELLHTTKRKKMLGFISRCLVLLVCHEKC